MTKTELSVWKKMKVERLVKESCNFHSQLLRDNLLVVDVGRISLFSGTLACFLNFRMKRRRKKKELESHSTALKKNLFDVYMFLLLYSLPTNSFTQI